LSSVAGNVNASRKLRILVVENDPEWLGLVFRLFQDHVVKPVRYHADALQIVEAEDMVYDVAIVDLNLMDPAHLPPGHRRRDLLGGELLTKLYENHPATLRIALTGLPPRGPLLRGVDQYHVYEFFMKQDMDPADLRSLVLDSPVAKAAAKEPAVPGVEARVAEQREKLQGWAEVREALLNQQIEGLEDDLRSADRLGAGTGEAAADEAALRATIARLAAQLADVPGDGDRIGAMLDRAKTVADVARAGREIDRLMGGPYAGLEH
jgi:hypothetical protein